MTRKQLAFIILVNAVISAVISVVVALLVIRPVQMALTATPTIGPTATQSAAGPPPSPEPVLHVVQTGDTISGLALQYDVPEADIIAANQLANPNFLQVGTELLIPVGGLIPATPTLTPVPTATDTPIPFEPPSADMTATAAAEIGATATELPTPMPSAGEGQIQIAEILGAGEVEEERVVIANVGEGVADMQGWTLSDTDGNTYTFSNLRLWAGGSVTVHTRIGTDGNPPANFFWGKLEAIWSLGEVATLKSNDGAVMSTYTVEP
jgi:LysM repeat protein